MCFSGVNLLNISLDTLKPDRYQYITRRKGLDRVIAGIERVAHGRFDKVKVNCVLMRGFNTDEIVNFAELACKYPVEVRFIEFMPFAGNDWTSDRVFTGKEALGMVLERFPNLTRVEGRINETCKLYKDYDNMKGELGFISSLSDMFCASCNRLRVTSDGNLKVCLFGKDELSLRDMMRSGASDDDLVEAVAKALLRKKKQHGGRSRLDLWASWKVDRY